MSNYFISGKRAPTVKRLMKDLPWLDKVGDPTKVAKQIRDAIKAGGDVYKVMDALDYICETHGLMSVPEFKYLNVGDLYVPTIIWSRKTNSIRIGCESDLRD